MMQDQNQNFQGKQMSLDQIELIHKQMESKFLEQHMRANLKQFSNENIATSLEGSDSIHNIKVSESAHF